MMKIECWSSMAELPLVTLPEAYQENDYVTPGPLASGNEPVEVALLIEIEVFL
jgi:hypothetical protein